MNSLSKKCGLLAIAIVAAMCLAPRAQALHGPLIMHDKSPAARARAAEHRAAKAEKQMRAKPQHGGGQCNCY